MKLAFVATAMLERYGLSAANPLWSKQLERFSCNMISASCPGAAFYGHDKRMNADCL